MMKYCDLHTHSRFSDGSDSPRELIENALSAGLAAVALCDHDSIDGVPEFLKAAENKEILAIPGVEITAEYNEKEVHIVGLYIPKEKFSEFSAVMAKVRKSKEQSRIDTVQALKNVGYDIDYNTIKEKNENGNINRVHIALELVEKGYFATKDDVFAGPLADDSEYYIKTTRMSVWEALSLLKSVGAIPIIAHPFLNLSKEELLEFLPKAKEQGLEGMECYYSKYSPQQTESALEMAKAFSLKISGGSDYHGKNKKGIRLGIGMGNLKIPYELLNQFKK